MKLFNLNFYSCEIPDNFSLEKDEGIINIYDKSNGVGALQISSYKIPDDYYFDRIAELTDFIKNINNIYKEIEIKRFKDEDKYLSYDLIDVKERYWHFGVKFENNIAIFITYNCNSVDENYEFEIIKNVVKSIKINLN